MRYIGEVKEYAVTWVQTAPNQTPCGKGWEKAPEYLLHEGFRWKCCERANPGHPHETKLRVVLAPSLKSLYCKVNTFQA